MTESKQYVCLPGGGRSPTRRWKSIGKGERMSRFSTFVYCFDRRDRATEVWLALSESDAAWAASKSKVEAAERSLPPFPFPNAFPHLWEESSALSNAGSTQVRHFSSSQSSGKVGPAPGM
eukprot:6107577-Alexandrium_andersonii.AAC.1